jgi:serine/threonine-protein kinase
MAAFADDLNRLLEHRPVSARAPGPLLRARRWAQRRPALATGAVLGLLLVSGTPTALWLQGHAHAEELRAAYRDEQLAHARAALEGANSEATLAFVLDLFREASATVAAGEPLTAGAVLAFGADLAQEEFDDPWQAGRALLAIGRVYSDLRQYDEAIPLLERAAGVFERMEEAEDESLELVTTRRTAPPTAKSKPAPACRPAVQFPPPTCPTSPAPKSPARHGDC